MNNTVRIMVSGGIATVIQRAMELNPFSPVGFGAFMAIFAVVSGIWVYFSPNEDVQIKQLSQDEKEQKDIKSKESKQQFLKTIKKILWGDKENISDARLRTFIRRLRQKTSKNLVLNAKYPPLNSYPVFFRKNHIKEELKSVRKNL